MTVFRKCSCCGKSFTVKNNRKRRFCSQSCGSIVNSGKQPNTRQKQALRNAIYTPSRKCDETPEPTRPELEQAVAEWRKRGGQVTVLTPQPLPKFEGGEPILTVQWNEQKEGKPQRMLLLHDEAEVN